MLSFEKVMGASDLYSKYDSDGRIYQYSTDYRAQHERKVNLHASVSHDGGYGPVGFLCASGKRSFTDFDAIFTRIGAADDLVSGQSTFMVEMMEANNAISHATKDSLILFDELGRGTATYDGMALAQSIIEYIHEHTGAKTLFATHYHELTSLESSLEHLVNVHVATLEQDGQVTFLHKIEPGPADKSYGIHVAKIAGLPADLLARADKILTQLESQEQKVLLP